ncbi:TetR/AcrR family transcriptional regulator [Dyella sp. BiH032]|uniref:TetR/AcrR family transcriptional regulator n=1 Tax=Dyella sp. BiH032 TaxID=3075430 RepID=UPI0028938132|nr:TetR/AcrR family transcriptional regulator [Dyella sp. BiH032]WNL46475.1 TetR/AcrR family transcriptional regulator [Dyella sp. BiH032]
MSNRPYLSPLRSAAAAEKRKAVLDAATDLLRQKNIAQFSLDAVAKAAGVTRLTVYNQFGSRRGLFEAVLDELAQRGRLLRLPAALEAKDPAAALDALIEIFCDFWAGDSALGRLHDAIALDAEFGEVLQARSELRRQALTALLKRMGFKQTAAAREAVDLIYTMTSCAFYRSMAATQSDAAVRKVIKTVAAETLHRLKPA